MSQFSDYIVIFGKKNIKLSFKIKL